MRCFRASWLLLAGLVLVVACDEDRLQTVDAGAGPSRCLSDDDCPDRNRCNVSTGVCFPLDACGPDRPCPDGQSCVEGADGFRTCVFDRCTSNAECISEVSCTDPERPRCVAGACMCGLPCDGGCPDGRGCCLADETCRDLPPRCGALSCPLGQAAVRTSTGTWSPDQCRLVGESCECAPLPALAEGDIGRHAALALDGRRAVVSAYNATYGDLMVGERSEAGEISWTYVDGVPTSTLTVTGRLDGPRGGQSGPGRNVGHFTDIEVTADGERWIAYQDVTAGRLRFARGRDGAYTHHVVDEDGLTGRGAVLSLSPSGAAVVVHLAVAAGAEGRRQAALRISRSEDPRRGGWSHRSLALTDLSQAPCAVRCLRREACLTGGACAVPDANGCTPECGRDQACVLGRCQALESAPPFVRLPPVAGFSPSISWSGAALWIAHHDVRVGTLSLLRVEDEGRGAVTTQSIAGPGAPLQPTSVAGRFSALATDDSGAVHIAYTAGDALRYAVWNGSIQTDEVIHAVEDARLGADVNLRLTGSGPVLVYQDASEGRLMWARKRAGGAWRTAVALGGQPGDGSHGYYADLALGAGRAPLSMAFRIRLLSEGHANGLVFFEIP